MPNALSTQGQGSTSYISMPNWSFNALSNTAGTSKIEIEFKIISFRGAAYAYILTSSGSTQNAVRIDPATGRLQYRTGTFNRIETADGAIQLDTVYKVRLEFNKATTTTSMYLNDVLVGSPYVANNTLAFNQINRFSTTANTYVDMVLYSLSTLSDDNYSTYRDSWNATTAPSTGTTWTSTSGTRNLTVTTFTGTTDSWWVYYDSGAALPVKTGTFTASAVAGASMPGTKIALGTYAATGVISAAVSGSKFASGAFSAGAVVAASIAGTKIARGTAQAAANVFFGIAATTKIAKGSFNAPAIASATLQGGNNVTVGGTFTASAVAGVSMPGKKVVFGTFAASAVAAASVAGSKRAGGTFSSRANASAAASGSKIASATFSATALVRATMTGYNASIQMPVTEWVIFTNSQPAFELSTTSEPSATLVTLSQQEFSIHTNS